MNTQRLFLALMLAGFFAFTAVTASYAQVTPNTPTAANFVDADGDGVCDNAGQALGTMARQGRRSLAGQAQGQNFVDADGDGVCDLCGQAGGNASGRGMGQNQTGLRQGGQGQMLRLHEPGTGPGGQVRQGRTGN
jgi:hypothetical protein